MPTLTRNLFYGSEQQKFHLDVEGDWPADMDGHLFNVGPARVSPGHHWFAGQGTLMRVACAPEADGRICVDFGRVVTPMDRLRQQLPELFRVRGVCETSPFGFTNFANTNVQFMGDRLFLGYDVGRPVEVDPVSLEFITSVGTTEEWAHSASGTLEPMIGVGAHPGPGWDEQALYFANYEMIPLSPQREVRVCRWDLEGPVEHWKLENTPPFDSIHDVKTTRDHVVIADLPFITDLAPSDGSERRAVGSEAQLFIISKSDLRATHSGSPVPYRQIRLPMMGGHLSVDYDDAGGEIVVYIFHHPITDLGMGIEPDDVAHATGEPLHPDYEGMTPTGQQPVGVGRYRIDARSGKVLERQLATRTEDFWGPTLSTQNIYTDEARGRVRDFWMTSAGFDPELITERWWRVYAESHDNVLVAPRDFPREAVPGALVRIDAENMTMDDLYAYPAGSFPHPPTFVPRTGATDPSDGYILVSVHRDGEKAIDVFDAQNIAAGPVARASAPGFNHPLLLHSAWSPAREGPRPSSYRIDPVEDAWGALAAFAAEPGIGAAIGRSIFDAAG